MTLASAGRSGSPTGQHEDLIGSDYRVLVLKLPIELSSLSWSIIVSRDGMTCDRRVPHQT